jgi:hypothetical protein
MRMEQGLERAQVEQALVQVRADLSALPTEHRQALAKLDADHRERPPIRRELDPDDTIRMPIQHGQRPTLTIPQPRRLVVGSRRHVLTVQETITNRGLTVSESQRASFVPRTQQKCASC